MESYDRRVQLDFTAFVMDAKGLAKTAVTSAL
jgi:hypothetical protein